MTVQGMPLPSEPRFSNCTPHPYSRVPILVLCKDVALIDVLSSVFW